MESDPSVVNLTAFETFLYERSPFFVEGTGLYRFELNCTSVGDCSTNEGLFYSRRIGRFPRFAMEYGDETTPTSTAMPQRRSSLAALRAASLWGAGRGHA